MGASVRRVVTGHNDEGRAVILFDGPTPNRLEFSVPDLASMVPWLTSGAIDHVSDWDPAAAGNTIPSFPAAGETIVRVADFPPDTAYPKDARSLIFGEIHGSDDAAAGSDHAAEKHFWFHRTDSLDYAVVLDGEITLVVDEGEATLQAGDVVVQRATSHAWSNRTDKIARVLFVLIGTPPLSAADIAMQRKTADRTLEQA
ncbi:Cupin domain-containing protein [Pseudarthrobacter enclensis]|nr:cupin domain-containing protein [Pseudarthrobacter enclensis]SCC30108.1 Cupin domain-containing protein [Pseudarthrobacter enclensis]